MNENLKTELKSGMKVVLLFCAVLIIVCAIVIAIWPDLVGNPTSYWGGIIGLVIFLILACLIGNYFSYRKKYGNGS